MTPLATLLDMLTYCRPCGSTSELAFIRKYIEVLPGAWMDDCSNWHVQVTDDPILWSSHTDTVHRTAGRQTVHFNRNTGIVGLSRKSKRTSDCLGADDTAGVFLMCEMIKRSVPGYYLFHYGEEVGGIGSSELAAKYPEWLARFTCAIALDRGGCSDVITHQGGRMTASNMFAASLADVLNRNNHALFEPCDRGIFTDTANYSEDIAECTNVSVGYSRAHSSKEVLDTRFLFALLESLSTVRLADLTIARKPGEEEPRRYSWTDLRWAHWLDSEPIDLTLPAIDTHPLTDTLSAAEMAEYIDDRDDDRSDSPDWYLDPEYADVQLALRRYRQ